MGGPKDFFEYEKQEEGLSQSLWWRIYERLKTGPLKESPKKIKHPHIGWNYVDKKDYTFFIQEDISIIYKIYMQWIDQGREKCQE